MKNKVLFLKNKWVKTLLSPVLFVILLFVLFFVLLQVSPKIGAYGADFLRKIIGNPAVAKMETAMFKAKDLINIFEYQIGMKKPTSPWGPVQSANSLGTDTNAGANTNSSSSGANGGSSSNTPLTDQWNLPAIPDAGSSQGAGLWIPYIQDQTGRVVAYRTFVQPDPKRPYSVIAIVAFDLNHSQLNFALGTLEPYAANVKTRAPGIIPQSVRVPGILLSAFNGGFKYEHGHFGAYSDGLTSAPPIEGLGTLAIYKNGTVKIGAWGSDITASNDIVSYRQNGPALIVNGIVSNKLDDPILWGETIEGGVVTWRSGIALSKDSKTLFYFAGPSLTITSLANTMTLVKADAAIELDINNFWVHFVAMRAKDGTLYSEPLFPKDMISNTNRFLAAYSRDFFYITAK